MGIDKSENPLIFTLGANYNPYEDSQLVEAKSGSIQPWIRENHLTT